MTTNRGVRIRVLADDPRFNYLPDTDRYLAARSQPEYKLNQIGTGINGQEHIRITHLEGRAAVHGIYDPNPRSVEMAKATHKAVGAANDLVIYDSLEAACNDPEVDGLIISTPNYTHLDVVKVAAESGKHILLEKPLSTTIKDAAQITQIAESYSAVFQIGLQYRYKSIASEAIHEALERRTIGDIKLISMQEHRIPFLDKVGQWNKFARYSGDTLIEKCCHYFDLLNLFAQSRPKTVMASGGTAVNFKDFEYNGEPSDILDNAMVIINYENGIRASFNLCMFAPMFYEELILCGDAGHLRAWEKEDFLTNRKLNSNLEILCGEDRTSRHIKPGYPSWIEESGHNGATFFAHVYFIDNIEGKETSTATATEGLWSVIVAAAAQASIKRGQIVSIDEFLAEHDLNL